MIETKFEEIHPPEWIQTHLPDKNNAFLIYRKIIPWEKFVNSLSSYYSQTKGAKGKNIRMMSAISIYQKLEQLSDRGVILRIKNSPYAQYFCNIPPNELYHFVHHSSLSRFRKRIGSKGVGLLDEIFFASRSRSGSN